MISDDELQDLIEAGQPLTPEQLAAVDGPGNRRLRDAVTEWDRKQSTLRDNSDAAIAAILHQSLEAGSLRFDLGDRYWYHWTGDRWGRIGPESALGWVHDVARKIAAGGMEFAGREVHNTKTHRELDMWASGQGTSKAKAVLEALAARQGVGTTGDLWDRNPHLLGIRGGVVDLDTGELVEAAAGDYVRRHTTQPWSYQWKVPHKFVAAMELILPDRDVRMFVYRALGYMLTGDTGEQVWFFLYGAGENGKTFLAEVLHLILGDAGEHGGYFYAGKEDTFTVSKVKNPINFGSAMNAMRGARVVVVPEVSKGELDTDLMKRLSGGESMTYRAPYGQKDISFLPSAKLIMYGNSHPTMTDSSEGNWRRILEIPFEVKIPDAVKIKDYWKVLVREEGPDIQRFLIEAAKGFLTGTDARGMATPTTLGSPPAAIVTATREYRESSDPFASWQKDRVVAGPKFESLASALFADYFKWCEAASERAMGSRAFGERMATAPGVLGKEHRNTGTWYLGVKLMGARQ